MTYSEKGEQITLEMSRDEYDELLWFLGVEGGRRHRAGDIEGFSQSVDFVNRLNQTNPRWRHYNMPVKFKPCQ